MRRHRHLTEAELYRLPQPPQSAPSATGFVLCPAALAAGTSPGQWAFCQMVYQLAFAQAQAVARPSLPERDLLAVWN